MKQTFLISFMLNIFETSMYHDLEREKRVQWKDREKRKEDKGKKI